MSHKLQREKKWLEHEHGPFVHAGEDWSQEQNDHLLDLWLANRGIAMISKILSRPPDTIKKQVWKLATAYRPHQDYTPGPTRQKRSGPLSKREMQIVDWGMKGEGQKRKPPVTWEHIARVLNRELDYGMSLICKRTSRKGFFDDEVTGPSAETDRSEEKGDGVDRVGQDSGH